MKLIVGLGNPGNEYVNTRHNIGFEVLDNVAKKLGISQVQVSRIEKRILHSMKQKLVI